MGSVGYSFLDLWIFSAKCKWPLKPLKRKRTLVLFFPTNSNLTKAKKLWQQLQVLSHKNSLKHNTGCLNNKMVFMICLRSGLWIKGNEIIRAPNPEMLLSEHPDTGHVLIPGVNKAYSFLTSFLSKLNSSNYWNCLVNLSRSLNNFQQCADVHFTTTFCGNIYITLIMSQLEDPWVLWASQWSRGIHTSVKVALWE